MLEVEEGSDFLRALSLMVMLPRGGDLTIVSPETETFWGYRKFPLAPLG